MPRLTSLRAFAALAVFLYHAHLLVQWRRAAIFSQGYYGVSFFFVLSGVVLVWSLPSSFSVRSFWRRRAARVWPSHALMALVCALVPVAGASVGLLGATVNLALLQSWRRAPADVFTLNGVSWSLSVEAFFYAAFPLFLLILRRVSRPSRWLIAIGWFAVCAVISWIAANRGPVGEIFSYVNPLVRSGEFVVGMTLGLDLMDGHRLRMPVPAAVAVLAVATAGVTLSPPPGFLARLVLVPCFLLVLASAASADLRMRNGLLSAGVTQYLGRISFGFYLVHAVILRSVHLPSAGAVVVTSFALAMLGATALHHLVEVPAQALLAGHHAKPRSDRVS